MEKYKKLKISLITLLLALVVALGAAIIAINGRVVTAYATDRFVELDGNSVFYTAIYGAEIEATAPDDTSEDAKHYTLFKIGSDETLSYRQNLAYKWISASGDEDGKPTVRYLSMELYFPEINFKRYYIKFESQQYVLTEDEKSTNYLVFIPNDDKTAVQVAVVRSLEDEVKDEDKIGEPIANGTNIKISIDNYYKGNYDLTVNGTKAEAAFKNVNESFASYVASGDSAVTPLTFGAEFAAERVETEDGAQMALVDISGQSFEMHKDNGVYKVKDTAAPVLCFSQTPSYLEYGKTIGFQYRVIDVLANITSNSSRATAYYYVLTGEQVADVDFEYTKTDYETKTTDNEGENQTEGGEAGEETKKQTNPFKKISTSSTDRIYSDKNTFVPRDYLKSDVMGLVKIYYELSDYATSSMAKTDTVFVDWYIEEALGKSTTALVDVNDYTDNKRASSTSKFLKLIKNKEGATYARADDEDKASPLDAYKDSVKKFRSDYQKAIDEAIEKLEDGKLYAGGKKFYLPAIEWDFLDEYLNGTDYKYSIYYRGATSGSNTSLSSNKLSIDLNDADVTYRFTIFVTDAFGNPMRYPTDEKDENGKVVWEEIKSSDVWDEDFAELLPYFEFDVSYKEATAEPPENLSISYVKSSYSGVSFKITGVSGTYTSTYKLYVFDRNAYYQDKQEVLDYDTFVSKTQELFDAPETRKYFTTVKPVSELLESDENYETFKALNWNATGITFTPQSVEDFYVIELQLTDNRSQNSGAYYATVASSVQTKSLKGESDWLEYNKTSLILFVVAGVCLIALIVLLVIKPKDKGDIDAIYSEVEGKEKKSDKKNKI